MFQLILAFQLELPFEAAAGGPASGRARSRSRERGQALKLARASRDAENLPLAFDGAERTRE